VPEYQFKFHKESVHRYNEIQRWFEDNWPHSYGEGVEAPMLYICERCGVEHGFDNEVRHAIDCLFSFVGVQLTDLHKRHDGSSHNDGEFWVCYKWLGFPNPCSTEICRKCLLEISPALMSHRDVCELDLSITYLERAISCRKSFLKHKVKSKPQANLERCLSMPQKAFSMATWTWTELPQSTDSQKT